jgi:predicted Rossmann fold nucleotide-binding protein DprA/Smf involved in DNA uptake
MSSRDLSERAKAMTLLCSTVGLGSGAAVKPFGPVRWHSLRRYVEAAGLGGPEALIGMDAAAVATVIGVKPDIAEQVARLLERAGRFSLDMERIAGWGIWVLTEFDEAYPELLTMRLGDSAPPLLFGGGDRDLLRCEGVAVVGSRRPDDAGMVFAQHFGAKAADLGLAIVSGAARGVDETAMSAATARGGISVGVVADSLERLVRRKAWRERLLGGELVLVSEYHPSRRFDVGWAMQRNRVVYCLSRAAVVVASTAGGGGTWAGATENAKAGWVPLFVRAAATAPEGNRRLLETVNARALPDDGARAAEIVAEALASRGADAEPSGAPSELTPPAEPAVRADVVAPMPLADSSSLAAEPASPSQPPGAADIPAAQAPPSAVGRPDDFFPRVAAFLISSAVTQQKVAAVAEELGVPPGQARTWLARAVDEELLSKSSKGYAQGSCEATATSDALASDVAVLEAGIAAVERLHLALHTHKEAVDRIASTLCVEAPLARKWLNGAAAKLSQPLFTVDDDASPSEHSAQ